MDRKNDNEIIKELQDRIHKITDAVATASALKQQEHDRQMSYQNGETGRLKILMRETTERYQQRELQYQLQEEEANRQLEALFNIKNVECRLRNQESYYAAQASATTDELTSMRNEAWEHTIRMDEEFERVRSEFKDEQAELRSDMIPSDP